MFNVKDGHFTNEGSEIRSRTSRLERKVNCTERSQESICERERLGMMVSCSAPLLRKGKSENTAKHSTLSHMLSRTRATSLWSTDATVGRGTLSSITSYISRELHLSIDADVVSTRDARHFNSNNAGDYYIPTRALSLSFSRYKNMDLRTP